MVPQNVTLSYPGKWGEHDFDYQAERWTEILQVTVFLCSQLSYPPINEHPLHRMNPQTTLQNLTETVKSALNMAPSSLPKTFKQAVFKEKGAPLTVEEVELKMPQKGEVLVKVEACGVCHSDMFAQLNVMGGGLWVVHLLH